MSERVSIADARQFRGARPVIARRVKKTRKRLTWKRLARLRWPKAVWIHGDGPFASVAHCPVYTDSSHNRILRWGTVELHKRREDAEEALRIITGSGCGGDCHRDHELVDLRTRETLGICSP